MAKKRKKAWGPSNPLYRWQHGLGKKKKAGNKRRSSHARSSKSHTKRKTTTKKVQKMDYFKKIAGMAKTTHRNFKDASGNVQILLDVLGLVHKPSETWVRNNPIARGIVGGLSSKSFRGGGYEFVRSGGINQIQRGGVAVGGALGIEFEG